MNAIHTFVILAYQESEYLEECIQSCLHQTYQSNVIIATTTNNAYIQQLAQKYALDIVEGKHTNIGGDFDFAIHTGNTDLVTIAHQDDVYDKDYAKAMVDLYQKYPDSIILFSDYYEIRNQNKVSTNTNLKIKRILLTPLKAHALSDQKWIKRWCIRFGNGISCPAVTFVKKNCPDEIFASDLKCNVDWNAWEKLSKLDGRFSFDPRLLMGHRISEESTTTDIIKQGIRTKEDYYVYRKFWPEFIAKRLTSVYKNSEKSNEISE